MFSSNRGSTVLPVASDSAFGPVYWVASNEGSSYYVKMANYGNTTESVTINIEGTTFGVLEMLSGGELTSNFPNNVSVSTVTSKVSGSGRFAISLPAWAVAVLIVS